MSLCFITFGLAMETEVDKEKSKEKKDITDTI